jgi:hypothetical protein
VSDETAEAMEHAIRAHVADTTDGGLQSMARWRAVRWQWEEDT